jgi:hypothetical protein
VAYHERYEVELFARVTANDVDELEDLDKIRLALGLAEAVWSQEDPGPDGARAGLAMVLAVAEVGNVLELDMEEPALLWYPGSILSKITEAKSSVITAGAWCIALARGHGAAASAIADNLVEDLRTASLNQLRRADAGILDLERLDSAEEGAFRSLRFEAVVILLHGMLSTDIGTFDGFLKELRPRLSGAFGRVLLLGWPHDTLTGIWNNAQQLAELIQSRVGTEGPDIIFVCHSRGGLVGRAAALRLYDIHSRYRSVLQGAITFGTPHEGAGLVGVPSSEVLGHFVSLTAAAHSRRILKLSDLLLYRKQQRGGVIQGIEDLRPPDAGGFIAELRDAELRDEQKREGHVRYLRLCCVGGDYQGPAKGSAALAQRFFGRQEKHDLVVGLDSSLPRIAEHRITVNCSHSEYCSEPMRQSRGLRESVEVARGWIVGNS